MDTSRKNCSISVALTERERQILIALAGYEERKPSDALRLALREAARRRGLLDSSHEGPVPAAPRGEPQGTGEEPR
jgi:hypothetical protein